jgi:hypothetical protein
MVEKLNLTVNADNAVVRRGTSSRVVIARVLGREVQGGDEVVYLDRLVHGPHDQPESGGTLSGAISTVYTRPLPPAAVASATSADGTEDPPLHEP